MAIKDANKALLKLDTVDDTAANLASFTTLTSATLDTSSEVHSARHMTSTTPEYFQTYTDWTLSAEGLWDTDNTALQPGIGSSLAFELYPEGTGSKYSGSGIITAWSVSGQMDNAVQISFSMQGNSDLSYA